MILKGAPWRIYSLPEKGRGYDIVCGIGEFYSHSRSLKFLRKETDDLETVLRGFTDPSSPNHTTRHLTVLLVLGNLI